ncbi:MAG: DUF1599 domain-containing protein [Oscillospiraceae bacterium]|nr:DUF1599 domain-containing protein [Oscillospiraceae bacterium]
MPLPFERILADCRGIFQEKLLDYGPAWLAFRWLSLVDQIYIKLCRIRALEEAPDERMVADAPRDEYLGIINYCLVGLMKDEGTLPTAEAVVREPSVLESLDCGDILGRYDAAASRALGLLAKKDHDYGAAWRGMAVSSITDQMIVKILRVKHILDSPRRLAAADSLPAQFMDILNYCLFSLILIEEH